MLIVGIDPGDSGGIAVIPLFAFYRTKAYPLKGLSSPELTELLREIRNGSTDISSRQVDKNTQIEVFLENPSLSPYIPGPPCRCCKRRPTRNAQSIAHLSRSTGLLEGIALGLNIPITLIHPIKWQNGVDSRTKGDKKVSKEKAVQYFPFLEKTLKNGTKKSTITHQTADALLIALYGYLQYSKKPPIHLRHLTKESNNV